MMMHSASSIVRQSRPRTNVPGFSSVCSRHCSGLEGKLSRNVRRVVSTNAKLTHAGSRNVALSIAPVVAAVVLSASAPAQASDLASVGTCLLQNCQTALAQCLGDANCLKNIVCLNSCEGRPDKTSCQIRCGDLYEDQSVDIFNSCAVSDKKCVPLRVTEGLYPVPPDCAVDRSFSPTDFTGRWFITAGYNELFDIFDCQVHYFASPDPNKMLAKINWRIAKPDGDFIERSTMQSFVQEPSQPGVLLNHGNEYLHYEDDWYIIKSKKDAYFFVYYKGNNDAWKGYGGAVVYTRAPSLPAELVPELREAAASVGLEWDSFKLTNNTCPPHPPPRSLKDELQDDVKVLERNLEDDVKLFKGDVKVLEQNLEGSLKSFGRGFTVVESNVLRELTEEEQLVSDELMEAQTFFEVLENDFAEEFGLKPKSQDLQQTAQFVGLAGILALLGSIGAVGAQRLSQPDPEPQRPTSKRETQASLARKKSLVKKK